MSTGIINGNTFGFYLIQASLTPVAVAANSIVEQSFTVPNLNANDFVDVATNSFLAGVSCVNARVSAANTLTLAFQNSTAGSLTPPAGTYAISVQRPSSGVPAANVGG